MKKILISMLSVLLLLPIVACGNANESKVEENNVANTSDDSVNANKGTHSENEHKQGETVLKLSFNQSIDNPEAVTILEMSDKLYEETDGRYSIEVYPNEQLGTQKNSLESVQNGAIDMAIVANTIIENVNSDFAIIGAPYIYDSVEQQQKLFESDILDDLFASTKESGFKTIAAYGYGPRCLYGKKEYESPEDLSGQKIRVMQSETMTNMLNLMGGVATPMAQGDVYSAIQSGTLDGAENNIITYIDLLQYEVAPYFSETNHLMIPDELIINNSVFEEMSEEDQEVLLRLAKESVTNAFDKCAKLREEYYDKAKNEFGVTITKVEVAPFKENVKPILEEIINKNDVTKEIYDELQKLK